MTDRWGLGKHLYYPNMQPIESDIGVAAPMQMIERIGQQHLLVQTITTSAVEMMKLDGTDRRFGIVLELEGRLNRTEIAHVQQAILTTEVACVLLDNIVHSLKPILDLEGK
jgi:hypothetical protein